MSVMFFKILFLIGICLGVFLFASWFFSCLYTEWLLDAEERARRKQEQELKDQDPVSALNTISVFVSFTIESSLNHHFLLSRLLLNPGWH